MVRGLAQILRVIADLPLRRMLAVCLVACLALSPLSGALALHHADDLDAVSSLSTGPGEATTNQTSDHGALPASDHDCHACSVAVLHAPSGMSVVRTPVVVALSGMNLVDGRDPGAELRPPRA